MSALSEIFDPRLRRMLVLSLVFAAAILAALSSSLAYLLHHTAPFGLWYLDGAVELLGGLAILALTWLLFPAVATLVLSLFLDRAIALVEQRRYPGLPPPRRQSLGEILRSGARLALLAVALNLLALPLYLVLPGLNLVLFYGLNGWLLGREYFELVALRRMAPSEARLLWREHWPRLVVGGMVIAVLLTVPVVNLAAPLIAALFMLHIVERLRSGYGVALAIC